MRWSFVQLHGCSPREYLMRSHVVTAMEELGGAALVAKGDGRLAQAALAIHSRSYTDDLTSDDYQAVIDRMDTE